MVNLTEYFNYVEPMTEEQLKMYRNNMTAVSLFAGVGGFDLALERNGVKVVSSVEIDKHATEVLKRRFPNSTIFGDVQKVNGNDLRNAGFIPNRGIITGGFPCQDLSVAGKRAGLAGARSGLFYEIARIADESKAEWLVLENVPGLLSSQRGADMGAVVGTLVELGYGVAWRVLDAQHFGVPQRRRRVFIVARRAGDPTSAAQVLFERQSLRGDSSTGRTQGQETAGATGESSEVAGALTAAGIRCDLNKAVSGHLTVDEPKPVLLTMREGKPGGGKGPLISEDMSLTLATGNGQVLIEPTIGFSHTQGLDPQPSESVFPTLRSGGGGMAVTEPMAFDEMNFSTAETHHTLRAGTPQSTGVVEPTLYEPHHGDGRAVQGRANTLNARMGTGGNNLPVLIEPLAFAQNQRDEVRDLQGIAGSLQAQPGMKQQTFVAETYVKAKRAQNATDDESWREDTVTPTLNQFDTGDTRATVVAIEPTTYGQTGFAKYTEGATTLTATTHKRPEDNVVVSPTLSASNNPSRSPQSSEVTAQVDAMFRETQTVRRLTPLECERLQGFPDGWTEYGLGEKPQADSHRYKQMGNAVAVPVVEWVIRGIMEVMADEQG